ncbi:MAG: alanine racemase [Cryobacterium sp.]|nr:alanine racemase [Oligoflexia bacterium]
MDADKKKLNWSKLVKSKEHEEDTGNEGAPGDFDEDSTRESASALTTRFDRVRIRLSKRAIQNNYETLAEESGGQAILPMIKADGYGHGAVFAARALAQMKNLYGFGTASLDEAREVREAIGAKGRNIRIMTLSGAGNWSEEKGQYCERFGITPTLFSEEDWRSFLKGKWPARLKYHLKFNTGMNRLGMSPGLAQQIVSQLKDKPADWRPEGVASHLAIAEEPDHPLTRKQMDSFRGIMASVRAPWSDTLFHIANSSAIWNARKLGLSGLTDVVRPGISIYGVSPWPGGPTRGLTPVMALEYAVVQRRTLEPRESIGYGAQFRLAGNESPMEVAILSAGYADGLHRVNSGTSAGGGRVWLGGKMRRFLGVVSMDLSAIECDASTRVGEWAQMLGDGLDPWTQAKAAGTIPYELLTSVSRRVRRTVE